ncbi:MAG: DUF115 domain-containing protein [Phycisphaeraceae bacterium]|nr:DUF115 domain-containing protein [Phycisphaeraceae bacterium]
MTLALDTGLLDANLAALGERHRDLADRLRAAPAPRDLRLDRLADGAWTGTCDGVRLASARDPIGEGARLAAAVDVLDAAAFFVMGFGLGHHVRALAERLGRAGIIVVFEPDLGLLREVFSTCDLSGWMKETLLVLVTDADDPAELGTRLSGAESVLGQGVTFVEHPPSRRRLEPFAARFRARVAEHLVTVQTALMTTLVRSVETVRNVTLNLPWLVDGPGIVDLAGAAQGAPAIVISAGPSLCRTIDRLADPAVRDTCVLIAAQTTLKPLLARGIRPHFVTALDYHEISTRFYEGLTRDELDGITLVCDPKAHPRIPEAFAGLVRCFSIPLTDELLAQSVPSRGCLPPGATVAHLSLYLAEYLGCRAVALVGQDLGFPEALYYAPGTAIHDVWTPELGPFCTIAMKEWERIARHRALLHRRMDVAGRPIYTDTQMLAYLMQFERDFARLRERGVQVFDATGGGVAKAGAPALPLARFLERHATRPLPFDPGGVHGAAAASRRDPHRGAAGRRPARDAAIRRLREVDRSMQDLAASAGRTEDLLDRLGGVLGNARAEEPLHTAIDAERARVEQNLAALDLLNHLNQLGVFKRTQADRRIQLLARERSAREHQEAQLARDRVNVQWIRAAAEEMSRQVRLARARLEGRSVPLPRGGGGMPRGASAVSVGREPARLGAVVAVDPVRGGTGAPRRLEAPFGESTVFRSTLEALDRVAGLERTILLLPDDIDRGLVEALRGFSRPVTTEFIPGGPFSAEQRAIAVARRFGERAWRGGIAGLTAWDEVLAPAPSLGALERHGLDGAVIAGPDWARLDPRLTGEVVARFREDPAAQPFVFAQAPPGLAGAVVSRSLLAGLAGGRHRLATLGALLGCQPGRPRPDPIVSRACITTDHRIRGALLRAIADDAARSGMLARGRVDDDDALADMLAAAAALAPPLPRHVVLELTERRTERGVLGRGTGARDLDRSIAARVIADVAAGGATALTLGGRGDPLLHPAFMECVRQAKAAGIAAIHVRTALSRDSDVGTLLDAGVDVVSVLLHADTDATLHEMRGGESMSALLARIERLVTGRTILAGTDAWSGLALPWIVPVLERRAETLGDLEAFYDRWQHGLGTAVIESAHNGAGPALRADGLIEAVTPRRHLERESSERLYIRADGVVPVCEIDAQAGELPLDRPLAELWPDLLAARQARTVGGLAMVHP